MFNSENSFNEAAEYLLTTIFSSKDFDLDSTKILDNRDLKILNSYHYKMNDYVENVLRKVTLEQDKQWLSYRYNVLKIIALGDYLSKKIWTEDFSMMNKESANHINHNDTQTDDHHLNVEMFENLFTDLSKQHSCCMEAIQQNLKVCFFFEKSKTNFNFRFFSSTALY